MILKLSENVNRRAFLIIYLLWFCLFHEVHLFDPYIDVDMPINNYYSNEILIEIRERYALMISQYMYNDWARLINGSSIDYPCYYSLLYSSNPAKLGFPKLWFVPGPSKCAPTLLLASHLQLKNVWTCSLIIDILVEIRIKQ